MEEHLVLVSVKVLVTKYFGLGTLILLGVGNGVATATVYEYDSDGNQTIIEKRHESVTAAKPPASTSNANLSELKELTRTVGIRFSGEPGVRKAGLTALAFVDIFEALIQAESNFDPTAVSPKGAQGLGQLLPGTASDLGVSNPFDPHQNLIGAAQYFTTQLLDFGSLDLALAAYNAGPDRVRQYDGVPPFAETRKYIAKITARSNAQLPKQKPEAPKPVSAPINKQEKPLTGETSVWEF